MAFIRPGPVDYSRAARFDGGRKTVYVEQGSPGLDGLDGCHLMACPTFRGDQDSIDVLPAHDQNAIRVRTHQISGSDQDVAASHRDVDRSGAPLFRMGGRNIPEPYGRAMFDERVHIANAAL